MPDGPASSCRRWATRSHPASSPPRPSAAGATGSTRSCSALPTELPWGLEIDAIHRPSGYEEFATFHPTFLYESLWLVGVALVLVWADRRFQMGHGRVFALYVLLYCGGRIWIEALRIDSANTVLGLRLNVWTALVVGIGALAYLVISSRMRPGRETVLTRADRTPQVEQPPVG